MAPRETENNAYAKFWGDKQRSLWYVMVFLEWSITLQMEWLTDFLSSYKQITGIVMQATKRVQLNVALESVNTTR